MRCSFEAGNQYQMALNTWPTELTTAVDFRATADDAFLGFETGDELIGLRNEVEKLLEVESTEAKND